MIDELHVRDVALIRDATIEPATGLTVLTGETGAGKTALLSSIKLLVGERSDAGMVREGSAALEVEGRLFLRGDDEDGTVVRRRVSTDGRGRVELNGHMASVRELADRVGSTVDLCGQHEHQRQQEAADCRGVSKVVALERFVVHPHGQRPGRGVPPRRPLPGSHRQTGGAAPLRALYALSAARRAQKTPPPGQGGGGKTEGF